MVHHEFRKGQKVLVILKNNNNKIIDKYYGKTSKYLKLENQNIECKNIRSSTIYNNGGVQIEC